MTNPSIPNPSPVPSQEIIPIEWAHELNSYPEGSHERAEFMSALGELGFTNTVQPLEIGNGDVKSDSTDSVGIYAGFKSVKIFDNGATLPTSQFKGTIESLASTTEELTVEVIELESDLGNKLRVIDLRPQMNESMAKVGPKSKAEQDKLDTAYWRDMKAYCDTGVMRNTVTAVSGVGYTRAGDTKLRSYWMPAKDAQNSEKIRCVARLADSGNNAGLERKLYRKLFAISM